MFRKRSNIDQLGHAIALLSKNGLPEPIAWPTILDKLPALGAGAAARAARDLSEQGLLEVEQEHDSSIHQITPRYKLYWKYDSHVHQGEARADSAQLLELILRNPDAANASTAQKLTGWPIRRMNPALALIADLLPDRFSSQDSSSPYAVSRFALNKASKRKL